MIILFEKWWWTQHNRLPIDCPGICYILYNFIVNFEKLTFLDNLVYPITSLPSLPSWYILTLFIIHTSIVLFTWFMTSICPFDVTLNLFDGMGFFENVPSPSLTSLPQTHNFASLNFPPYFMFGPCFLWPCISSTFINLTELAICLCLCILPPYTFDIPKNFCTPPISSSLPSSLICTLT